MTSIVCLTALSSAYRVRLIVWTFFASEIQDVQSIFDISKRLMVDKLTWPRSETALSQGEPTINPVRSALLCHTRRFGKCAPLKKNTSSFSRMTLSLAMTSNSDYSSCLSLSGNSTLSFWDGIPTARSSLRLRRGSSMAAVFLSGIRLRRFSPISLSRAIRSGCIDSMCRLASRVMLFPRGEQG